MDFNVDTASGCIANSFGNSKGASVTIVHSKTKKLTA